MQVRNDGCKKMDMAGKKYSVLLRYCVLLVFAQCTVQKVCAQNYTTFTPQIQYRICQQNATGQWIANGNFVYLRITAGTQEGKSIFNELYWIKIIEEASKNSLEGVLRQFLVGDSIEILLPYKLILNSCVSIPRVKNVAPKDKIVVNLRVLRLAENKNDKAMRQMQAQQEKRFVAPFVNKKSLTKQASGVYKKTLRSGNGKRMQSSGTILYTGYFLNGTQFDNSTEPFTYIRGVQFQMIDGIVTTLSTMSEGEKVQVVIPYDAAFGERGLADIVPPFTTVVYDIEMLKVR
ncbi:hypothetical protein AGMMS4956_02660 [Bacteroidia bacterium]|nr:hypothetical protein AGMMS4956_02660 [Bacteroidia bacterium]